MSESERSLDAALQQIRERHETISNDDRLAMEPANVMVNAPLALIQTEKRAKADTLAWVLELLEDEEEDVDR